MHGEVVLITGGSSGIGLAAARLFVHRGARVWITGRDPVKLERAAAEAGAGVRSIVADVAEPASIREMAKAVESAEGRLDVLVNSAGQFDLASVEESAAETAERLMRVNYLGVARTVAATLPLMRVGGRRSIVNLSSFVGRVVPPFWSAYAASKHAVQAYTHALRQELRPERFHVGLVLPGPVATPMVENFLRTPMYPVPIGVPVMTTDRIARAIVACVLKRRTEVTVPGHFGPLLRIGSALPRLVDLLYRPYRGALDR
jgi:NAD(P)-dependent dehydrogenase (short-subunit alcohol dehydrogenase family)